MSNSINLTLQRLLSVEWELNQDAAASHLRLLKEHFRRLVLWAKQLDCVEVWPYFNVATYLDPTLSIDERNIQILRQHLKQRDVYSLLMIGQLERALYWDRVPYNLRENGNIVLPDPYEPLLIMYERGGIFTKEDGFLIRVSEWLGFRQGQWTDFDQLNPFVELDKATLDWIDSDWQDTQ